jgi:hypothetical protein
MDKIIFDIKGKNIVGYNIESKPNQFSIHIPSIIEVVKTVIDVIKIKKRNMMGEQLYSVIVDGKIKEVTMYDISNINIAKAIIEEKKVNKQLTFLKYASVFTLEDILNNKRDQLLVNNDRKNIILCEINLHENIDINFNNHNSNIGFKTIKIPADSCIKLKPFILDIETKNIMVNIESDNLLNINYSLDDINYKSCNSIIKLNQPTNKIYLKFNNTNETTVTINSYNIMY